MKIIKKALLAMVPSFLVFGALIGIKSSPKASEYPDAGVDTALYDEVTPARLDRPDIINGRYITRAPDDDEEEDQTVVVNKVILHYFNENGGNDGRAFYLWVTGQDGVEYNLENASDIMTVNADRTMMTITLDFVNDARFTAFAGKSKLFFIIKYKMINEMNLNWGGQSDDMQLVYSEFPPQEGSDVCEVWTMPAAGGGIAILDSENKTRVHGVALAQFTDWKTIKCTLTKETTTVNWELYAFDETYYKIKPKKREDIKRWYLVKTGSGTGNSNGEFNIVLPYEAHINVVYSLVSHDPSTDSDPDMAALSKIVTVRFDTLYDSDKFHQYYETANLNTDLGVTYTETKTTFKVWSPVSANLTVLLYDSDTPSEFGGDDKYKGYHMHYTSGGIWYLEIEGNLKGKYYNIQVDNTLGTNVTMDPYATSAGACGVRGLIYDKAETNPDGWNSLPLRWDGQPGYDITTPQELSIYEVHVQDFTGDSSWVSNNNNKNGTYNAFVESGTHLPDEPFVTTGYDHIKELGIEAVQLLPVFDHDNDESTEVLKYNWGYNPLNYNVVEGGYSSNPHDGLARVREFKNLVLQLSKVREGHTDDVHTRVIMDVVYNHVSSATGSNFHKLMPRYYFRYAAMDYYYTEEGTGKQIRYQQAGEMWDGSGCHNEVASERPMMRKFIVDSLKMWATEYKIKGFRFDLMGLIDFKTMIAAKEALYEIDPDIYLYGEGWTSGGYHGEGSDQWKQANPGKPDPQNFGAMSWQVYNECNNFKTNGVYLGGFNDAVRNAIRGDNNVNGYPGKGYLQTGNASSYAWTIAAGLWGVNGGVSTDGQLSGYYPEQTINYASCHDNWTVRDQLYNTLTDGAPASPNQLVHGVLQAHALIFAGNSAAFMLGGEELLRTKELNVKDLDAVTADSYAEMHGHFISHNSYNAPASVNTFKWGNKLSVTIDGQTIDTNVTGYSLTRCFSSLIRMHKTLAKKRGVNNGYNAFVGSTSGGHKVDNIVWGGGEWGAFDSTSCAMQVNETFVYLCTGNDQTSVWGDSRISSGLWEYAWDYGGYTMNTDTGKIDFWSKNTIVIFNSKGNC